MNVLRTEQIKLKPSKELSRLCHISNNLYNEANYIIRHWYFHHHKFLFYSVVNWLLKDVNQSQNYRDLGVKSAQQILLLVEQNWQSFFAAREDWNEHPEKYKAKPRIPGYRKKNGEFQILLNNQQIRFRKKSGLLSLGKKFPKISTRLPKETALKQVRILPQQSGYLLEIVYEKEILDLPENREAERITAIDLGMDNLITMVNNFGEQPIVIEGKPVKALNQWFNKQMALLQGVYDRQSIKQGEKRIIKILKRRREVKSYFHKATRIIIDWCLQHNVDTLVIGYNKEWKQNITLGRKNNQNFANIPFLMLVKQLEYKGRDAGIVVIRETEEYTSKCSFIDLESIQKHKNYKGKRIHRGLFRSAKGILINADVNAAYNILRKVFPKAFSKEDVEGIVGEAIGLHPQRLSVFAFSGHIGSIRTSLKAMDYLKASTA